jgi:hypothetical protein
MSKLSKQILLKTRNIKAGMAVDTCNPSPEAEAG